MVANLRADQETLLYYHLDIMHGLSEMNHVL